MPSVDKRQEKHLQKLQPLADSKTIQRIRRLAKKDFASAYAEVTRMDIKSVVNEPKWQKLRSGLVGTWKTNAKKNVELLRTYLGDKTDPFKVRRVMNYLTGSAFRIGVISHDSIDKLLRELRNITR